VTAWVVTIPICVILGWLTFHIIDFVKGLF
jgi:phosphate/sulfate permease